MGTQEQNEQDGSIETEWLAQAVAHKLRTTSPDKQGQIAVLQALQNVIGAPHKPHPVGKLVNQWLDNVENDGGIAMAVLPADPAARKLPLKRDPVVAYMLDQMPTDLRIAFECELDKGLIKEVNTRTRPKPGAAHLEAGDVHMPFAAKLMDRQAPIEKNRLAPFKRLMRPVAWAGGMIVALGLSEKIATHEGTRTKFVSIPAAQMQSEPMAVSEMIGEVEKEFKEEKEKNPSLKISTQKLEQARERVAAMERIDTTQTAMNFGLYALSWLAAVVSVVKAVKSMDQQIKDIKGMDHMVAKLNAIRAHMSERAVDTIIEVLAPTMKVHEQQNGREA